MPAQIRARAGTLSGNLAAVIYNWAVVVNFERALEVHNKDALEGHEDYIICVVC